MSSEKIPQLFEVQSVRTHWDEDQAKWYFSIVNVIAILSESIDPQAYWRKLKQRLTAEGNKTVTYCHGLKILAKDGNAAKQARVEIEKQTGEAIVSNSNAKSILVKPTKDK